MACPSPPEPAVAPDPYAFPPAPPRASAFQVAGPFGFEAELVASAPPPMPPFVLFTGLWPPAPPSPPLALVMALALADDMEVVAVAVAIPPAPPFPPANSADENPGPPLPAPASAVFDASLLGPALASASSPVPRAVRATSRWEPAAHQPEPSQRALPPPRGTPRAPRRLQT
jgi:hypothetical protein